MNTLILTLITVLAVFSCSPAAEPLPFPEIIPFPQHVESSRGTFDASEAEVVCPDELDSLSKAYISSFSDRLSSVKGHSAGKNRIVFKTDPSIKDEAYSIKITPRKITVRASGLNGFVYAVQTLKQMMPADIYGTAPAPDADWLLPCCTIDDCPRFGYRGMLIDVARYFSSVEEVKKFLDMMEIHKMNVFHWHLTDDQGWRIEIKKYPELTTTGSKRRHTLVGHHHVSNEYDGIPWRRHVVLAGGNPRGGGLRCIQRHNGHT